MARQTLEKIINGDSAILESYRKVKNEWRDLLANFDWNDANALVKMTEIVTKSQFDMEQLAGERWLGQEIMVIVGIGQFYNSETGFDDSTEKATLVRDAFLESHCSSEIKFLAEEIGKTYRLED